MGGRKHHNTGDGQFGDYNCIGKFSIEENEETNSHSVEQKDVVGGSTQHRAFQLTDISD